ncbi:PfkB family carbohydrate kinase [Vallitalea sediminicola]
MSFVATITPLFLDMIFSDMPRMPQYGEEVFADKFDIQLGGGSMVPAILLSRFQVDSRLGTFLANDITSSLSRSLLEKTGITYKNLYKGDKSPVVVTSVSTFPQDRCFTCHNPRLHEKYLTPKEVYEFYKGAKICFVFEGYDDVFKRLKEEGTIIIYDLGWDDNLNVKNIAHILDYTDVFTPNDKEAMKMTGTDNVEDALEVLAEYVAFPIVKIGGNGCMTLRNEEIIHVPMPMEFNAIDTTGAGDNFLAGIMYGLYNEWNVVKCMQMGNVLGGYSTTTIGCYGANITYEEAMEIMRKY